MASPEGWPLVRVASQKGFHCKSHTVDASAMIAIGHVLKMGGLLVKLIIYVAISLDK